MKIYYNGKRVRDRKGRFARPFLSRLIKSILITGVLVLLTFYAWGYENVAKYVDTQPVIIEKTVKIDTAKPKIEKMKWDIVDELADCESGGIEEGMRNSLVVMDTNGYYSRGKWQFQLRTIQHYMKVLDGVEISLDEATLIAHTEDKARTLAYRIIWEEVGGVWNWKNCTDRLGLAGKIEIIRELEK